MSVISASDNSIIFNFNDFNKEDNVLYSNNLSETNSCSFNSKTKDNYNNFPHPNININNNSKGKKVTKKFLVNEDLALKRSGKWTKEEDDILSVLVPKYGGKNWKKISEQISGRSPIQCLHRWTKILQPGLVKGPWTVEEDRRLMEWVKSEGPTKWSQCSEYIKGRNGKQCRERWFNTLNPEVKKGNWEIEEDYKIFFLFTSLGGKWSKITNLLEGRTENSIKNRFYSTLRRLSAEDKKKENMFKEFSVASQSLDELLKYLETAILEVTVNFCQSIKYTNEELQIYNSKLLASASENINVSRKKSEKNLNRYLQPNSEVNLVKPEAMRKYSLHENNFNMYNETINICNNQPPVPVFNENNNNSSAYISTNNNNLKKDYRKMDIFSLERDIINFNDDSSMFYGLDNDIVDDQVDIIIKDMFARNNIENYNEDDKDCNFCFKDQADSITTQLNLNEVSSNNGEGNRKDTLNTLLAQLNDLEATIQNAKLELLKKGADECSTDLDILKSSLTSVDGLFKF